MNYLEETHQKPDIVDICNGERANLRRRFFKITNLSFFTSLIQNADMGCKDFALPELLLKNRIVWKIWTLKSSCNNRKLTNFACFEHSLYTCVATPFWIRDPQIFQPLSTTLTKHTSHFSKVFTRTFFLDCKMFLPLQTYLCDITFVDWEFVEELTVRSIQ